SLAEVTPDFSHIEEVTFAGDARRIYCARDTVKQLLAITLYALIRVVSATMMSFFSTRTITMHNFRNDTILTAITEL
ncbi:11350_t:CDS:2, partial [Gigaspora rosea]